jgi:hypothetical protein
LLARRVVAVSARSGASLAGIEFGAEFEQRVEDGGAVTGLPSVAFTASATPGSSGIARAAKSPPSPGTRELRKYSRHARRAGLRPSERGEEAGFDRGAARTWSRGTSRRRRMLFEKHPHEITLELAS